MSEVAVAAERPRTAPAAVAEVVTPAGAADRLFHDAPCGYLVTTDDGCIQAVNDTFVRWSGRAREDLIGTPVGRLFPIGDRILYATHCQPMLEMVGVVAEIAVEVVTAGGARRAALLSAARTPATDDTPASVRVVIFSAHERRRYEKELLAARRAAEQSEAQRADAEAGLQHLALHDSLTGLLNRAGLTAHLDRLFAAPPDTRMGLALLFVDLDHFKAINDSLGHAAGDELIVTVARRLTASVRGSAISRLAGDEFVVLEKVRDTTEVVTVAQRLLELLNAPVTIDGIEIVPSASIGVALTEPDDTPDRLLRHADIAMYRAKSLGRNTWHLHDPLKVDPATGRLRVIGELRHGIERGELRVHYQPRIDLGTGQVHSAEALVRWQHPTRGLLSPDQFVDIAEESGLIRRLGARVLDEAVGQATRWRAAHPQRPPLEIAVNLSPRQLTDPALQSVVTEILARHRFDPALLTLEITETALMADPDAALAALSALKRLGVLLAVDDFGTGYSSFTYLKRFPVDELKIDRSFVAGLGTDTGDTAIVASCIQLAHAVGIRAVAEGVETDGQYRALVEMGCDYAQGYHFGRPVPPERFDLGSAGAVAP
ncbi:sensor domain-containing phosphodiesterase [Nakamurella deserti]|uniref:sensor domain-containing protein n=1 Tax=Nakamurella deserti TaxID=2164074 RepID=UPI000DBE8F9C|nr:sensor domain-containing phosphodiesterase [Nakamurella deserti]